MFSLSFVWALAAASLLNFTSVHSYPTQFSLVVGHFIKISSQRRSDIKMTDGFCHMNNSPPSISGRRFETSSSCMGLPCEVCVSFLTGNTSRTVHSVHFQSVPSAMRAHRHVQSKLSEEFYFLCLIFHIILSTSS